MIITLDKSSIKEFRNTHTKNGVKLLHFLSLCGLIHGYYLLFCMFQNSIFIFYPLFLIYLFTCSFKINLLFFSLVYFITNIDYQTNTSCFLIIIISYLLTDVSHIIFNEKAYRTKYDRFDYRKFLIEKIKHHMFLPLLILDCIFYRPCNFSSGTLNKFKNLEELIKLADNRIITKKFTNYYLDNAMNKEIDEQISIDNIINSFLCENFLTDKYERVSEIDELYITNSNFKSEKLDKIVDEYHIDGHIPNIFGIKTYRLLILIQKDENDDSRTIFDNIEIDNKSNLIIFDYNRQLHRASITENKNLKNRILLKIHFITYPKFLENIYKNIYKKLLIFTNKMMRKTQNKNTNNDYSILTNIKKELLKPTEII